MKTPTANPVDALVHALTADLAEAEAWLQACQRDHDEPPWVHAMGRQIDRIRASATAIEHQLTRQSGYGAQPHGSEAKRPEGYPMDQPKPHRSHGPSRPTRPLRPAAATSRAGIPRTTGAASRPEKPAV
jgi:hypothetical protein